jgi:hypothetical protein
MYATLFFFWVCVRGRRRNVSHYWRVEDSSTGFLQVQIESYLLGKEGSSLQTINQAMVVVFRCWRSKLGSWILKIGFTFLKVLELSINGRLLLRYMGCWFRVEIKLYPWTFEMRCQLRTIVSDLGSDRLLWSLNPGHRLWPWRQWIALDVKPLT